MNYKPINLNDITIPEEIRTYLKDFDFYSSKACTSKTPADRRLTVLEAAKFMGDGNLNIAIARFRDRFDGYTLDFINGTVSKVQVAVDDTGWDTGWMNAYSREQEILDEGIDHLSSLTDYFSESDQKDFPKFIEEFRFFNAELLESHPELIDPDAFEEFAKFMKDNPKLITEGNLFVLADEYLRDQYGDGFHAETVFTDELKVLTQICQDLGSEDNCLQFIVLWGMHYEWNHGLKDYFLAY